MIMWRSKLISNPSSLSTGSKRTTSQEASTIDIIGDDSQNAEPILDRIESKKSMQRRAADAIEKIAKSMDESGIATVSLMKEQLSVTKEAEFRKKEILQHQLEIGALEKRKKALEELVSLKDNGVISREEFVTQAKNIAQSDS
jgi:hypothetical protein